MGNNLFASHKGQRVKKSAGAALVGLVLFGVLNNAIAGQVAQNNAEEALLAAQDSTVQFRPVELYPQASASPSATATAGSTAATQSDEERLKNQVLTLAQTAGKGWVNYDTSGVKAETLGTVPRQGQEGYDELQNLINQRNEEIKNSESRSTGSISSAEITAMTYNGSLENGSGEATVRVTAQQTVVDKTTGSGGSSSTRIYLVTVTKGSGENSSTWIVKNIQPEG